MVSRISSKRFPNKPPPRFRRTAPGPRSVALRRAGILKELSYVVFGDGDTAATFPLYGVTAANTRLRETKPAEVTPSSTKNRPTSTGSQLRQVRLQFTPHHAIQYTTKDVPSTSNNNPNLTRQEGPPRRTSHHSTGGYNRHVDRRGSSSGGVGGMAKRVASLSGAALRVEALREEGRAELVDLLESLPGSKCLVLEGHIGGLLNHVIPEGSKVWLASGWCLCCFVDALAVFSMRAKGRRGGLAVVVLLTSELCRSWFC